MSWCGNDNPEHRVRYCMACQAAYQKHRRKHLPPPLPSVNLPRQHPRFQRTPLNDRVDALYAECAELGGCMAGPTITRYGYVLAPCVRCAVPVKARGWAWRDNSTMFRNGEAA